MSFIVAKRLSKLIGSDKAKKYFLTNEKINSEEILKIGLITNVYPQKESLNKAKKLAENISKNEGALEIKEFYSIRKKI